MSIGSNKTFHYTNMFSLDDLYGNPHIIYTLMAYNVRI
jgi:hypothetical protein